MEVHATLKSFPLLAGRLVLTCDSVSVPLCELREVSPCALLQSARQGRGSFARHSGIWKEIGGKEKKLMLTSHPQVFVLTIFLLASGSPRSVSLQGQIMDTIILPCEVQDLCCRFPKYSLWSPLGKMPFSDTLFFFFFFRCCEDASTAGISNPFLSCLFSLCCAHTSLHSQPWASDRVSSLRKTPLSGCCSCERCSEAILLFTQRFHGAISVASAAHS